MGSDDPSERLRRAAETYGRSRYIGEPPLWPEGGIAVFGPLLDEVLGNNHLVRMRLTSGARSARHTHDCDQVIIVTQGHGSLETDERCIPLSSGSVVFTPEGVPHVHAADEGQDIDYIYLTRTGHDTVVTGPTSHS